MSLWYVFPRNSSTTETRREHPGSSIVNLYSQPSQEWTFYEINPDVIALARNSQYFTYLQNCAKGSLKVIEGDARLNLQNADAGHYGVIVLDAFSSDGRKGGRVWSDDFSNIFQAIRWQ